jgi:hypothetical protein
MIGITNTNSITIITITITIIIIIITIIIIINSINQNDEKIIPNTQYPITNNL